MTAQPQPEGPRTPLDQLVETAKQLREIVEGVRNERWSAPGAGRLKDTKEWCAFYVALANFKHSCPWCQPEKPPERNAEGFLIGDGPGYSDYPANDY